MTREELERVRDLQERLRRLESKIFNLRGVLSNLVPIQDGTPRAQNNSSQEHLLIKILDTEREVEELKSLIAQEQTLLTEKILTENLSARASALMLRRYVMGQRFRDISFEMKLSDATMFRIHSDALGKIIAF